MTRLVDMTVGLGGVVESRRVHDTDDWPPESVALLEVLRPVVRAPEWSGPLDGVLDVPDVLPWLSWRRAGPAASFVCQTGDGLPVTYSVILTGHSAGSSALLAGLAGLPSGPDRLMGEPPAGAALLVDEADRPLLASRVSGYPVPGELMEASGQVETLLAVAFCRVLGAG